MITKDLVLVRAADEGDKRDLANLIHFETHVHRHLDWRTPLDWIGTRPFIVLVRNDQLLGALACPPDPPNIAWIRLFAVSTRLPLQEGWDLLWEEARDILLKYHSRKILAIPLQKWFRKLLEPSSFKQIRNVVILVWEDTSSLVRPSSGYTVRPMNISDLNLIYEIDRSAFDDEWQNSKEAIEVAFRQAAIATVVGSGDEILGYQISTGGQIGGHLARLAVRTDAQKKGIGYTLVYDLLDQFKKRGVSRVTVNTQQDNIASLRLYEKAGFNNTSEIFPIYQYIRSW